MTPAATTDNLKPLDPYLGPSLRRHDANDATRAALAVALAALEHKQPLGLTRLWLRSRGGTTRFGSITATRQTWSRRIVTPARRRYAASSPGGAGVVRLRLRVARVLVAHLLSPVPEHREVSAAAQINARRVLAAVATGVLDSLASDQPMDTALVSTKSLAVDLGLSEGGCRDALRACVKAKWIAVVTEPPGSSKKYRMVGGLSDRVEEVAWRYADAVDALTDGSPEPLADLIRAARHPAIGHHAEGATAAAKGWLWALADMAETPSTSLGLSPGATEDARNLWLGLLSADVEATLAEDLDISARVSGADERYAEKRARRAEAAAARGAEYRLHSDRTKEISGWLDKHLDDLPVPNPSALRAERDSFVVAMRERIAVESKPADWLQHLAKHLATRLENKGYERAIAERAASFVAGLDSTQDGAA